MIRTAAQPSSQVSLNPTQVGPTLVLEIQQLTTITVSMNDPTKCKEKDLPVHSGLVLYFSRCGCTFYNKTPHQIPRTNDPNLPDSITCQQMVPIDDFERQEQEMKPSSTATAASTTSRCCRISPGWRLGTQILVRTAIQRSVPTICV
jgi:hypothetical protein